MLECNASTLPERESGECVEIPAANPKRSPLAMGILGLWVAVCAVLLVLAPLNDCVLVPALNTRHQHRH